MNKKIDEFFENSKHILSMPEKPFESVVIPFDDLKAVLQFIITATKIIVAAGEISDAELLSEINPDTLIKYFENNGFSKSQNKSNKSHYLFAPMEYDSNFCIPVPHTRFITTYPLSVKIAIKGLSDWMQKGQIEIVYELLEMQQK